MHMGKTAESPTRQLCSSRSFICSWPELHPCAPPPAPASPFLSRCRRKNVRRTIYTTKRAAGAAGRHAGRGGCRGQQDKGGGGVAKRHATTIKLSKTSLPPPDTGKVNRAKVVNGA